MKYIKNLVYIFILVLTACEKEISPEINYAENIKIIVDGLITNEYKFQKISIFKPIYSLNASPLPITNATVFVNDGKNDIPFIHDSNNPGFYFSESKFSASINITYLLKITVSSINYYARSSLIPVSPSAKTLGVQFYKEKDSLFVINDKFESIEQAMWELSINWEQTPHCKNDDLCKAIVYYYYLNTADVSQIFAPSKEIITFPVHSVIVRRKYSLSDEHASFIRSMLAETEWKGGFFDENSSNVFTNLSEGANGYFAVSSVVIDSIIVK